MWNKFIVKDNFLSKNHFDRISKISFDTKPNELHVLKHKIYSNGKIEISGFTANQDFKNVDNNNQLGLSIDDVKNIHEKHHDYMLECLKELAPEKLKNYIFTELNVVNTGKDVSFPIHADTKDKLLSVVVYIAPEKNEGTYLYQTKDGKNPQVIEWKTNRAFIFSRTDDTWHSYKGDGISNRLTLVYNLRS
jgi:hypothetical protein